ncbi:hypothetical protein BEH94_02355 [Candidatus Altiarchaeales archaeon WOR_SM1_SCG]|nr:hypothetical protein BEH94_02355 [Candidatus Altiarchaeales archaeon WOR_SM1_SCG]
MVNVVVKEGRSTIPFSRGILMRSIVRSGLDEARSYGIAMNIKSELIEKRRRSIGALELFNVVRNKLSDIDPNFAEKYKLWRDIRNHEEPILILLGGVSGTGTTTVGAELGHRLGIRRVIGTDTIREVMRKIIAQDLLPTIHASSYDAWKKMKVPVSPEYDKIIMGFRTQAERIAVGVEALMDRALYECISAVIEGTHLVPGFIDKKYMNMQNIFFFILDIKDENEVSVLVVDHDVLLIDYLSDALMVFSGDVGISGNASEPLNLRNGMNKFLKEMNVTFRRDPETGRPRANKPGSVKDREQKGSGEFYYNC